MPTRAHWRRGAPSGGAALLESTGVSLGTSTIVASGDNAAGPAELTVTPGLEDSGNAVTNGNHLQAAILMAAVPDVLVLQGGATYETTSVNGFTFPATGYSWDNRRVTLCSSRIGQLPAGVRVSPSQSNAFAKLVTSAKGPAVNFAGSRGFALQGLEISYTAAVQSGASAPQLVNLTNALEDLTLDRCWVHPRESVTAPASMFRAVHDGISGIGTVKNLAIVECYVDGFTGWQYTSIEQHMGCLYSSGGTHLRVKNNFLQGYRTFYLEAGAGADDVVIQHNTFDCPQLWETWGLQEDHRHLILYAGTHILIVGNHFTGETRGSFGIFHDQTSGGPPLAFVRYLSNFIDAGPAFVSQVVLKHTPYPAHDVAFINNLFARGWAKYAATGNNPAWSWEGGGPSGNIAAGVPLTAGHGLNTLHNTIRGTWAGLWQSTSGTVDHCDIRYNISNAHYYTSWLYGATGNVALDFPNLLLTGNRFVDEANTRPAYVPVGDCVATWAALQLVDEAGADAGGPISGYALASTSPHKGGATGTATDFGLDPGCNIAEVQAALDGTSTDWDYPELPRAYLDTTYALPGGATHVCATTADLHFWLANAALGDVIQLQAGVTYTGPFSLPNKTGTGWIYIQSSNYSSLPAPGTRVAPSDAANMPKITVADTQGAILTQASAHHYRFVGIEITTSWTSATQQNNYHLANLAGGNTLATLPHDITFDRCYLHGHPVSGAVRALYLQSARTALIDSYCSDFKGYWTDPVDGVQRPDTQVVMASSSPGPIKIVNNYLEAAGENVMLGGEDPFVPQGVPSDVEVRGNLFNKPAAWNPNDSVNYAGVHYACKNMFEIKNGQRVLIDGNVFANYFPDAQRMAITITPRNQNLHAPWCRATDITFTHNRFVNNIGGGVAIQNDDNEAVDHGTYSGSVDRVLIQDNDFIGCYEHAFDVFAGAKWGPVNHLVIDHNISLYCTHLVQTAYGGPAAINFVFTNNIMAAGTYGFNGDAPHNDLSNGVLAYYYPGARITRNIIIGGSWSAAQYGPANLWVADAASVGFVDLAGGNHALTTSSPGYRAGIEGRSIGAEGVV